MLHLRRIDRLFGKGSLRALDLLGSKTENDDVYRKVKKYFESDNDEIRKKLRGELEIFQTHS